jgi:hypothetical protein
MLQTQKNRKMTTSSVKELNSLNQNLNNIKNRFDAHKALVDSMITAYMQRNRRFQKNALVQSALAA